MRNGDRKGFRTLKVVRVRDGERKEETYSSPRDGRNHIPVEIKTKGLVSAKFLAN